MPWTWSDKSHRYHDSATGRFLSKTAVLGYVQSSLDTARTAPASTLQGNVNSAGTDLLSNLVSNGMMNPRDWHEMMREEVKREYIREYMLGRGGLGSMTQVDWGSIGGMLKEQYHPYLVNFAQQVANGELTEGQIRARSAMYVNSAREAFERGKARANADATEIIWLLGPVKTEHCPDCEALAALGWQLIADDPFDGAYPCSGATQCLTNCRCDLDYRTGEAGGEIVEGPTVPEVPPTLAPAETPPALEARPVPDQETALRQDLADAQAAYDGALAAIKLQLQEKPKTKASL